MYRFHELIVIMNAFYNSNDVVDLQSLFILYQFVNFVIVLKGFCSFLFYLDKLFSFHPYSRCVFPLSLFIYATPAWVPCPIAWLYWWESWKLLSA